LNVKTFGVPVIVAINQFINDTDAEVAAIQEAAKAHGVEAIVASHWANGSAGTEELAGKVVELIDAGHSQFSPIYDLDQPLFDKIEAIATKIYGAGDVAADKAVRAKLKVFEDQGFGNLPICMAKTQYSFSTDMALLGAPTGHTVTIREVRLAAGAEFVVAVCGDIMTMPGLPRVPAANKIHVDEEGLIQGLF
ncbi:MAG: formate--tetrahydrofolate ligase, partial [Pseudomonadales bacterium]|nr:formate--tetrahydrofolate ligase [Pseudomonadales bacterium]